MPYENGYGYGWGTGSGNGYGYGSGDGYDGRGNGPGTGSVKARKKIELNILENIPQEVLLLYMHCWEFEETKTKYQERLKGI